jgi:D-alanine transaminase
LVNEGASSNAWIVTEEGALVTPPTTAQILEGITRGVVLELAARRNLRLEERRFTVDEAKAAREAFITAATALVTPVVKVDGAPVGNGKPGPTALALRAAFLGREPVPNE